MNKKVVMGILVFALTGYVGAQGIELAIGPLFIQGTQLHDHTIGWRDALGSHILYEHTDNHFTAAGLGLTLRYYPGYTPGDRLIRGIQAHGNVMMVLSWDIVGYYRLDVAPASTPVNQPLGDLADDWALFVSNMGLGPFIMLHISNWVRFLVGTGINVVLLSGSMYQGEEEIIASTFGIGMFANTAMQFRLGRTSALELGVTYLLNAFSNTRMRGHLRSDGAASEIYRVAGRWDISQVAASAMLVRRF